MKRNKTKRKFKGEVTLIQKALNTVYKMSRGSRTFNTDGTPNDVKNYTKYATSRKYYRKGVKWLNTKTVKFDISE